MGRNRYLLPDKNNEVKDSYDSELKAVQEAVSKSLTKDEIKENLRNLNELRKKARKEMKRDLVKDIDRVRESMIPDEFFNFKNIKEGISDEELIDLYAQVKANKNTRRGAVIELLDAPDTNSPNEDTIGQKSEKGDLSALKETDKPLNDISEESVSVKTKITNHDVDINLFLIDYFSGAPMTEKFSDITDNEITLLVAELVRKAASKSVNISNTLKGVIDKKGIVNFIKETKI